jgi:hypothetical protein
MLTPDIEKTAGNRLAMTRNDLLYAEEFYPRDAVRSALAYWRIGETA